MTLEEQKVLTDRLDIASRKYYNSEDSEFSDTEFDLKMHELMMVEKENNYVYPNSPTQRVGSDAIESFAKVKHPIPMLTIDNVYDDNSLEEWVKSMYEKYHCMFNLSVKYDGVSCELYYKDGILIKASTRGDKNEGDDITNNVKTIKSIPLTIESEFLKGRDFYVRGEILMPKSQLKRLNEECEKNNVKPFSNTRNACSGSIKLLDSKEVSKRGLIFRGWDCFFPSEPNIFDRMSQKTQFLEKIGFKYEDNTLPYSIDYDRVIDYVNGFKNKIDGINLDYDYDGIVIKIDDIDVQNKIGIKDTRAIEWGMARKWNEDYKVWTTLNNIEWSTGRGGSVTPVGVLEPVECGGVIVSNVSLFNAEFVEKYDLHKGNDVLITRSGNVIPIVVEVKHDILMEMNGAYEKCKVPDVCPVCGSELVREGPIIKCVNEYCPAIVEGKILQFCSKDFCDIKSIGESTVHDIVSKGLIKDLEEILYYGAILSFDDRRKEIKREWLKVLGKGYGEKAIDNIFDGIVNARCHTTYDRLIGGLSIPNVGKVMARTLCKKYKCVYDLMSAKIEDLIEIDGIAEITAKKIIEWLNHDGKSILESIDEYDWQCSLYDTEEEEDTKELNGLTICFTGKSSRFSGDEVEAFLESKGAKCTHSVSKSLSYLITGEKPGGSKVKKAEDFGIKIISENDFYTLFKI